MRWDPQQYARYADARARPFGELLTRVGAEAPRRVADLGCGPGALTAELARRWATAEVQGVDSSPEMIAEAAAHAGDRVRFSIADVRDWSVPDDLDVLVSNATLQWVPGHLDLLGRWARRLAARRDGWLAIQVPGNFDAPSHRLMRELATDPRWADALVGVLRHGDAVADAPAYAEVLQAAGLVADVWETTYLHVLDGPDPVLEWVRGTGLRPVLAALDPDPRADFEREYAAALREAYPAGPHGTVFAFRRIFAVGRAR